MDDFTILQHVASHADVSSFVQANLTFARSIRNLDLSLSKKKSALVGASADVARIVLVAMRAQGFNLTRVKSTDDLGVQTSGGRRRLGATLAKRFKKVKKRTLKLAIVTKGNRNLVQILKTAAWPAATYGHMAQGLSPAQVSRTRDMFAAATGVPGVECCPRVALAIALNEGDGPLVRAAKEQIDFWIDFWIDNPSLRSRVQRCWGNIWQELKGDKNKWKKAKGPISATICVLSDLKWEPMRADLWKDPQGVIFALRGAFHFHPGKQRYVAQHAECSNAIKRDALNLVWDGRDVSDNNKGPSGAYDVHTVKSLHAFLLKKDRRDLAGALQMGVCDGVPDQSKLFDKGLVASPLCLRCKELPDSPKHRLWECSANLCSQEVAIKATQRLARLVEDDNAMFWNRGLIAFAMYPRLPEVDWSRDFWCGNLDLLSQTTLFYSDGSGGSESSDPLLRRCGWSFVGLVDGHMVLGKGGGLVGPKQTVPRAELYALLQIAKSRPAGTACHVGVDFKYLVDGVRSSRASHAAGENGDLWDEYFSLVDSNNLSVQLFKVKSHLGYADIVLGKISTTDFLGNEGADAFAKRGAELWAVPDELKSEISSIRGKAWRVGMRMATVVAETVAAYKASPFKIEATSRPRRTLKVMLNELRMLGHRIEVENKKCHCSRCGISFLYNRSQCRALICRGDCKADCAPDDQISEGLLCSSSLSDSKPLQVPVSERDIPDPDEDPFDLGDMDLDGNFSAPPAAEPAGQQVSHCDATTFSEHRVFKGSVLLSVSSTRPVHDSHRMMYWAGIFYCSRCGSWGTVKARKLFLPCHATPTPAGALALKRIQGGYAPTPSTKLKKGVGLRPSLVDFNN